MLQNDYFSSLVANESEFFRWQATKVALIASTLRKQKLGGTVADVGCFTGLATETYRATGFSNAVGFDISSDALAVAETRGIEPRRWIAGIEPCPGADREFDAIVAADVIEHIVETDFFVDELRRVLRPGGTAIITTPNLAFWLSRLRLAVGKVPWSAPGASPTVKRDPNVDLMHIRLSTRSEWENLFVDRGFIVKEVAGWSVLPAINGAFGVKVRKLIDAQLTRSPNLAYGLLFRLENPMAGAD